MPEPLRIFIPGTNRNVRRRPPDAGKFQPKCSIVRIAVARGAEINPDLFDRWTKPGIRAQLLNTKTLELEMDFIVEEDDNSLHILNAVSPAFTCSFAFAKYLVSEKVKKI